MVKTFCLGSELEMQLRTVGLQRFSGTPWEISRMLGADLIVLLTATLTLILRAIATEPASQHAEVGAPNAPETAANTSAVSAAPGDCASTSGDARVNTIRRERGASGGEGRAQIPSFISVEARRQLLLRFQLASMDLNTRNFNAFFSRSDVL